MKKNKRLSLSRIVDLFLNILLIFIILGLLSSIVSKIAFNKNSIFGFQLLHVVSGSMEPTIMTNEIVLGRITDGTDVKVNDVVTYKRDDGELIIHRVIDIYEKRGVVYYVFKGDNNQKQDEKPVTDKQLMYKVIWFRNII